MATALQRQPADLPVRKAVRRLRWFNRAFHEQVAQTAAATGIVFAIDDRRVTAAFIDWLRVFDAQKPANADDRRAYVGFAAGLMLRTLIAHDPLTVILSPQTPDQATGPAWFWPQAFAYVAFCLRVRSAVLDQDFHEDQRTSPELSDLRVWWSFRENAAQDPAQAMAFLDLFAGEAPNWTMPDVFATRDAQDYLAQFRAAAVER